MKKSYFLYTFLLIFLFVTFTVHNTSVNAASRKPRPTQTPTPSPTATLTPTQVPTSIPTPTPEIWNYTAIGDSLAVGLYALVGYVPRYRNYVSIDNAVSVNMTKYAVGGQTSDQLLNALKTNASYRNSVSNSKLVTFDIGGADFLNARTAYKALTCGGTDNQDCIRNAMSNFKTSWNGILNEILLMRSLSNTVIRTMDVYNPYVNEDKIADTWPNDQGNDFQVFKPYADEMNGYIASTCAIAGIPRANVYQTFNGVNGDEDPSDKGYISFDGMHPNDTGHRVIADMFRVLGYSPLR